MDSRPLREIGEEFRAWFAADGRPQGEIAHAAGVDQSTVSRLVAGRNPTYVTEPLRRLCRLAGIELHPPPRPDPDERVASALRKLWDATGPHAAAIVALLEAARALVKTSSARRR